MCLTSRLLGLLSHSSYSFCGQFHIDFEQPGTSAVDRAVTMLSGSSDFLPRDPLTLSICVPRKVWQSHMHKAFVLEGEPTYKWLPILLLFWMVWNTLEGFLEPLWIKQAIFSWASQFNNTFLGKFLLLYYWLPKITYLRKSSIA